ncbi:growth/differentiation factor 8-like [Neocloeon triangulifer]|uniref:growth/differentiation factor 8-like n=1 Tax=Neocloeon triangulifer TaxID=2078957 RepID=UPI00286F0CDE|nr:growth/differentiation factor 8-like [Neocloeon triangulifer]
MMAAPAAVAAALALLVALLAPTLHGARSYDAAPPSTQRRLDAEQLFKRPALKREEVAGGSSTPYKDLDAAAPANLQQHSDEDGAVDDDLSVGGDLHRFTTGHTVLREPPAPGSYVPSNCSACVSHDEMRRISKQKIQEDILQKLNMRHAPNMTGRAKPKLPPLERLIENFGMQGDQPDRFQLGESIHEEEDLHAKIPMVFVVAQTRKLRHGGGLQHDLDIQHFQLSEQSIRNTVADATLYIHMPKTRGKVKLLVYKVVSNASEHESMMVLLSSASKLSEHREDGWVELDVKRLMQDWFKHPKSNLGVIIKIEDETGASKPYSVATYSSNGEALQPFVEIKTVDSRKYRTRRTVVGLNCNENSKESRCCRYPLTVDFDEFGWDWIIAPKRYESNYCSGDCPFAFLQKYPHTHIVQQANPNGNLGPCCAARKLSSISMLFFDQQFNIVYSVLPHMVVERCGCY